MDWVALLEERWKPVVGYEGLYDVSSQGRIRRASPTSRVPKGFILKPNYNKRKGYVYIDLCKKGVSKKYSLHTLVCIAFHGARPPDKNVNHIDGDTKNNEASNLQWTTQSENCLHSYSHLGRKPNKPAGPLNGRSKEYIITKPDGSEIRIKGLKPFCRQLGLSAAALRTLAKGHHKGYKCRET